MLKKFSKTKLVKQDVSVSSVESIPVAASAKEKDSSSLTNSSEISVSQGHDLENWKPKSKIVPKRAIGLECHQVTKPPDRSPKTHYHPVKSRVPKVSLPSSLATIKIQKVEMLNQRSMDTKESSSKNI